MAFCWNYAVLSFIRLFVKPWMMAFCSSFCSLCALVEQLTRKQDPPYTIPLFRILLYVCLSSHKNSSPSRLRLFKTSLIWNTDFSCLNVHSKFASSSAWRAEVQLLTDPPAQVKTVTLCSKSTSSSTGGVIIVVSTISMYRLWKNLVHGNGNDTTAICWRRLMEIL